SESDLARAVDADAVRSQFHSEPFYQRFEAGLGHPVHGLGRGGRVHRGASHDQDRTAAPPAAGTLPSPPPWAWFTSWPKSPTASARTISTARASAASVPPSAGASASAWRSSSPRTSASSSA